MNANFFSQLELSTVIDKVLIEIYNEFTESRMETDDEIKTLLHLSEISNTTNIKSPSSLKAVFAERLLS